jgi:hypothetical protein
VELIGGLNAPLSSVLIAHPAYRNVEAKSFFDKLRGENFPRDRLTGPFCSEEDVRAESWRRRYTRAPSRFERATLKVPISVVRALSDGGGCLDVLKTLPESCNDAVVCRRDPGNTILIMR